MRFNLCSTNCTKENWYGTTDEAMKKWKQWTWCLSQGIIEPKEIGSLKNKIKIILGECNSNGKNWKFH